MAATKLLSEITSTNLLSVVNALRHDLARSCFLSLCESEGWVDELTLTFDSSLLFATTQLPRILASHLWMTFSSVLGREWKDCCARTLSREAI